MRRRIQTEEDLPDEHAINLTPLIDVVFVLLISFMLIAPLLNVDRIELATAGDRCDQTSPQSVPLSILIRADNSIWVKERQVNFRELELILKAEKRMHPKDIPVLLCDKRGSFGTYQDVKNMMESCGFEQLDVGLKPK